jgi:hypothetical protein
LSLRTALDLRLDKQIEQSFRAPKTDTRLMLTVMPISFAISLTHSLMGRWEKRK